MEEKLDNKVDNKVLEEVENKVDIKMDMRLYAKGGCLKCSETSHNIVNYFKFAKSSQFKLSYISGKM